MDQPITLITGCSSGIGLETAVLLARRGHRVYASMRNPAKAEPLQSAAREAGVGVELLTLDVTDPASVAAAVEIVRAKEGRLTNLVNNAGFTYLGPIEEASEAEIRDQFETNVFGALRTARACLPLMRADSSPRRTLVNVSSIAGRLVYPLMGLYCGTKHALLGLTAAWRFELAPLGIRAAALEPGALLTEFGKGSMKRPAGYDPTRSAYRPLVEIVEGSFREMTTGRGAGGAAVAARTILRILEARRPRLHWTCGPNALVGPFGLRFLPYPVVEWYTRRMAHIRGAALDPASRQWTR